MNDLIWAFSIFIGLCLYAVMGILVVVCVALRPFGLLFLPFVITGGAWCLKKLLDWAVDYDE